MCSSSENKFWKILPTTHKSGKNMRASSQRCDTNVEDVKNISLNPEIFFLFVCFLNEMFSTASSLKFTYKYSYQAVSLYQNISTTFNQWAAAKEER